ncbi:tetratricopeptide repeat protein [bacterium]|nr:tetratricopeptide repeat protein [bacterium]
MNPAAAGTIPSVIDKCLDEFDDLWDRGQKPRADLFRGRFDSASRADFVELVYQEFCRAESDGLDPDPDEFLSHYAEFRNELERLFAVHFGLETGSASPEMARIEPASLPDLPIPGDLIGPYRLTGVIGQGGMGRVFRAEQTDLGDRPVVIKVVRIGSSIEPEHQARVDHPNVMPVYRHFRTDDGLFLVIVMPHLPGMSVDKLLNLIRKPPDRSKKRRKFAQYEAEPLTIGNGRENHDQADLDDCIDRIEHLRHGRSGTYHWNRQVAVWGVRLARALHSAFQRGIVHGDIKPGNIYVATDFQPYLLDFHLSRRWKFDRHKAVFEHDDPGGTLPYMPPERLDNLAERLAAVRSATPWSKQEQARFAHRGDLYSLALVLLELLTGHNPASVDPFDPAQLGDAARSLADVRRYPDWLERHPGFRSLPSGWRKFLEQALHADPAQRQTNGIEFAADLEDLARERGRAGILRKAVRSKSLRAGVLVTLAIGSLTTAWLMRTESRRQSEIAHLVWQTPYEFWDDPSSTQDRTLASRIAASRAEFDRLSGLVATPRESPLARFSPKYRNSRLDADLWYADRIENLSRLLAQRALRTGNSQDAASARNLIELGKRLGPTPAWIGREQELARKFSSLSVSSPGSPSADSTISNYVDLIASGIDDRKIEFQRWQNLIQAEPGSFALRWGFARVLAKSGRTVEAIRETEAALELDPGHFEARRLLAQLQFRNRDFESALKQIDLALNLRHDDISALRIRSILRLYVGHREELLSEIDRMGEILNMDEDPEAGEAARVEAEPVAVAVERIGSKEVLDTRTVERIYELFPKDREVRTLLVKKYYREKRFGEAIELMEQNAKSGPRTTQDLINLAILYRNDFRSDKATKVGIELIGRRDLSIWTNRKTTRIICLLTIFDVEKYDPLTALQLCRSLLNKQNSHKDGSGIWHYQIAKITVSIYGEEGLSQAIDHLMSAGREHDSYIEEWYFQEPIFDPYRTKIDQKLSNHFPKSYESLLQNNSRRSETPSP